MKFSMFSCIVWTSSTVALGCFLWPGPGVVGTRVWWRWVVRMQWMSGVSRWVLRWVQL